MNSLVQTQRSNSRFFFISMAFAIGLAVASGFFVKGLFSGNTDGVSASTKACLAVMRTNGFNPTVTDKELSVLIPRTAHLETLVYMSGVIIASCPSYTLRDYCAGAGCQKPGVTFTLTKKE